MAATREIYDRIDNKTDVEHVFREIRHDVGEARSRPALTELYKHAGAIGTDAADDATWGNGR